MATASWLLLAICGFLVMAAGCIAASALKLLQRIEAYVPPQGASRMYLARRRGDPMPATLLPQQVQATLRQGAVLFFFFSENCEVCRGLLPTLPGLVRSYRHVRFVLCSRSPLNGSYPPN